MTIKSKHKIGGIATTYRGINIYHATTEKGRKGYRITYVISKRFFVTIEAAKK